MGIKESIKDKIFQRTLVGVLCIMAVIAMIPLVTVVALSFSSKGAADMNIVNLWPVNFTTASWQYILTNKDIWRSFIISLVSTGAGVFLALLMSALMAYPLSKEKFRPAKVIMFFVIVTMIFKAPVVPYFLTLKGIGLFNNPAVLVLPHILSAYNLAIMRTFFKQFPQEVEEAAKIDGAGHFGLLFRIVLPSSKAVLATVGLFSGVGLWNQFQTPVMFIQDTKWFPLQLKIRQLISDSSELQTLAASANNNFNSRTLQAAVVVFAIIPIILIYPYLQKYFAKGAMLGSVKG